MRTAPVFYGWVVVGACFAVALCSSEIYWSYGVFFKALEQEFEWSRRVVSSGYTALLAGNAISAIAAGRLADKYSARLALLSSAAIAGPAMALCSQVNTPIQLQGFLFLTGLGTGSTVSVPTSTVQRWFQHRPRSGTALAIVMCGIGMGALVFAPLLSHLIVRIGWRSTFLVAGAIFASVVTAAGLVIRPVPTSSRSFSRQDWPAPSVRRLITRPQFLAVATITLIGFLAFQVLSVHLVPYATDAGIAPTEAAVALGLVGGFSIPGRIVSGALSDRLGWHKALAFALLGAAAAFAALPLVDSEWMLYSFVALYGVCHGMRAVGVVGLLGRLFGMHSLGQLIGITIALAQGVGAVGPYIAGYIFDRSGTYSLTFVGLGVLVTAAAVLASRLRSSVSIEQGESDTQR